MRFWTGHVRPDSPPLLVREGFSWGALIFGPFWLAAHRAWIPAALSLAAAILIAALTGGPAQAALLLCLAFWLGVTGNDLRRWSIRLRGYALFQVISARSELDALGRLLERRPDLAGRFMPPEQAR